MERLICLAVGYVCGLFQTGYLVGKMNHIDIRKEGSGNSGTTNALRVLGWKAGKAGKDKNGREMDRTAAKGHRSAKS